jgi:hypothetical protein
VTHAFVGQASTLVLVLRLGVTRLIFPGIPGILGEYVARICDEVRG